MVFAHFNSNQQNSTSEENSELFAHFNTNQQNSDHDDNSARRTRSGQIYVCLSKVVQETEPLFLHPSLTTLNWDMCAATPEPADTGSVSQTNPASDFSHTNQSTCDIPPVTNLNAALLSPANMSFLSPTKQKSILRVKKPIKLFPITTYRSSDNSPFCANLRGSHLSSNLPTNYKFIFQLHSVFV